MYILERLHVFSSIEIVYGLYRSFVDTPPLLHYFVTVSKYQNITFIANGSKKCLKNALKVIFFVFKRRMFFD